jgi:elongation of very long chain fatty acids protein 4
VGYDGDVYLTIVLNGFIHAIMYTYYFVALHTKDIWWKQLLTASQMIQFLLMNLQAGFLLGTSCKKYPPNIVYAYLVYILSLFLLFARFFINTYILSSKLEGKKPDKQKPN